MFKHFIFKKKMLVKQNRAIKSSEPTKPLIQTPSKYAGITQTVENSREYLANH